MKVIDILKRVTSTLSLTEENNLLESLTQDSEDSALKNEEIKKLINFLNLTLHEVCVNYAPMLTSTKVEIKNNIYPIANLTNYLKMKDVKQNGKNISYKILDRNITVKENGEYLINYYTYPTLNSLFEDLNFLTNLSPDVFVFGIIAFYCLSKGLFDEFKIYNSKYRDSADAIKCLKVFELPKREWV